MNVILNNFLEPTLILLVRMSVTLNNVQTMLKF